jgi:hypothetical protein
MQLYKLWLGVNIIPTNSKITFGVMSILFQQTPIPIYLINFGLVLINAIV